MLCDYFLTCYFHKKKIIQPTVKSAYFIITYRNFIAIRMYMHFQQLSWTTNSWKKNAHNSSLIDVINHKSRGRWNCCTSLEISVILPKPLHLLFSDAAKQTKIAWYSSSIFMFMFIDLFLPPCFLFLLLFGWNSRFD